MGYDVIGSIERFVRIGEGRGGWAVRLAREGRGALVCHLCVALFDGAWSFGLCLRRGFVGVDYWFVGVVEWWMELS